MKTIWKFEVPVTDRPVVQMPKGAVVLPHVQQARAVALNVWALVDPDVPMEDREFQIFGTGNPASPVGEYVGTVVTTYGAVWHVWQFHPPTRLTIDTEGVDT